MGSNSSYFIVYLYNDIWNKIVPLGNYTNKNLAIDKAQDESNLRDYIIGVSYGDFESDDTPNPFVVYLYGEPYYKSE